MKPCPLAETALVRDGRIAYLARSQCHTEAGWVHCRNLRLRDSQVLALTRTWCGVGLPVQEDLTPVCQVDHIVVALGHTGPAYMQQPARFLHTCECPLKEITVSTQATHLHSTATELVAVRACQSSLLKSAGLAPGRWPTKVATKAFRPVCFVLPPISNPRPFRFAPALRRT